MDEVERFYLDLDNEMDSHPEGDWVRSEDFDQLREENLRLLKALEKIAEGTGTTSWTDQLLARAALEVKE